MKRHSSPNRWLTTRFLPHFSNILCKLPAARLNSAYEKGAMNECMMKSDIMNNNLKKSNAWQDIIKALFWKDFSNVQRIVKEVLEHDNNIKVGDENWNCVCMCVCVWVGGVIYMWNILGTQYILAVHNFSTLADHRFVLNFFWQPSIEPKRPDCQLFLFPFFPTILVDLRTLLFSFPGLLLVIPL